MNWKNDSNLMNGRPSFLENIPVVTRNLLIVNVIMYIATLINEEFMIGTFAMFYPASPAWAPWRSIPAWNGWKSLS